MRILICDDNQEYVDMIMNQINECKDKNIEHDIIGVSDLHQLNINLKLHQFDIAFLDIELGETTGIEVAKKLKEKNPYCIFVFITNYKQYINDAIDLEVSRYLYKENLIDNFKETYSKVLNEYKRKKGTFSFNTSKGKVNLSPFQIQYIETYYYSIKIHTSLKSYFSNIKNISYIKKTLKPFDFYQVHQSYYVNLHYVYTIENDMVILTNGKEIPISFNRKNDLIKVFNHFIAKSNH